MLKFEKFEEQIQKVAESRNTLTDPAHDLLHIKRVVHNAKQIAVSENADLNIVLPAAWLHDFVVVAKDNPLRNQASKLSADAAILFLQSIHYPSHYFDKIWHAIHAHSFSAKILPESIEAKVVQDADRLDGLGAIGIARCFATAGLMKRAFYSADDPLAKNRAWDDSAFTLDHFYVKLFKTAETLQTETAKTLARSRVEQMKNFISQLALEIEF